MFEEKMPRPERRNGAKHTGKQQPHGGFPPTRCQRLNPARQVEDSGAGKKNSMNTKKAYIKSDGKIGEKEHPAIEYIDKSYADKKQRQKKELEDLLSHIKNDVPKNKPS
jgi:hypothetical protein